MLVFPLKQKMYGFDSEMLGIALKMQAWVVY